jgi:hypothetical protein
MIALTQCDLVYITGVEVRSGQNMVGWGQNIPISYEQAAFRVSYQI